jgi:tripartite-type tricarboxylate transporter receptor subunit TctC
MWNMSCAIPRTGRLRRAAGTLATMLLILTPGLESGQAVAQEWPTRPVRVIVPNGAGGVSDILARLTADRLARVFGQPFVIDNRGGAGGTIGTEHAARSPNDGYTLYFGGGAQFLVNPLIRKLSYDPVRELTPISMVSLNGMGLVVHPDLPVRSLPELIDYVKANPGKLNYGVAGIGQSSHLAPAALAARAGLHMVQVPYQATPQAIVGLLSGTVQMFFGNISDVQELVQGGKARLLAISTKERTAQFPDVPTVGETLPGYVMIGWIGYFAPVGTSPTIIDRLSRALIAICRDPEVIAAMKKMGIDSVVNSPAEFAAVIQADSSAVRSAVEAAGLLR